jgi:mediator of RNA polymerase II transcription subunit 7
MFTSSLLLPPPTEPDREPEWQRHAQWITVMAQNIMAAANDLRPVQARAHLEAMMKRQLELRREETDILNQYVFVPWFLWRLIYSMGHRKCDVLEAKLAELRASAQVASRTSLSKEGQENPLDAV